MSAYWCERAWLGGARAEEGVLVEIEGERIGNVEAGVGTAPEGAEVLTGLTIPGLANAHSHAFQRALRGRTQDGRGDFWTWREQMYAAASALDPDSYLALARATFAEMAMAGITLVGEFHYVHHGPDGIPYEDPNAIGEAVIEAAGQAGVRLTLLDTCYLHGGIGVEPDEVQRRFSDGSAAAWVERVDMLGDGPEVRIGAAIHSVRAVDPAAAALVAVWAQERGAPLHAHVSEQPAENEACFAAHGCTPTALLDQVGALSERFTAVHATHLAEDDFALLGEGAVCLCPTTERDLADGIGPARRLAEAGTGLCTGSDSNAVVDPFEEARAIELDERLATGERGRHTAAELLEAATGGGYSALGWGEGGRIEPGGLADLVTISFESVRLAGADPARAVESVVFSAAPGDVRDVIVGGEPVVREGRHLSIEVERELQNAIAAVAG